jgi:hypothetical protein
LLVEGLLLLYVEPRMMLMMMAEIAMRANAILPYTTILEKISAN